MKLTIVVPDNAVIIDGIFQSLDLFAFNLPANLRAVQWDGDTGWEEIAGFPNAELKDIKKYHPVIDAWQAAHDEALARAADPCYGLPPEEKAARQLAAAKAAKSNELAQSFDAAETAPIEIGGHLYKGGSSSGMALDAQRRMMMEYAALMPELGITTVNFYDVCGDPVTLPIKDNTDIDALDVCLAVGTAASAVNFKYAALMRRLALAETGAEVEAIAWA